MRISQYCAALSLAAALALPSRAQAQGSSAQQVQATVGGRPRVPYTGVNISGQPRFTQGVMRWATYPTVYTVDPGSQAERVGLHAGDVILMINGADSRDPETIAGRAGKVFVYRVRRGTTVREYTLTSTAGPAPAQYR